MTSIAKVATWFGPAELAGPVFVVAVETDGHDLVAAAGGELVVVGARTALVQ